MYLETLLCTHDEMIIWWLKKVLINCLYLGFYGDGLAWSSVSYSCGWPQDGVPFRHPRQKWRHRTRKQYCHRLDLSRKEAAILHLFVFGKCLLKLNILFRNCIDKTTDYGRIIFLDKSRVILKLFRFSYL